MSAMICNEFNIRDANGGFSIRQSHLSPTNLWIERIYCNAAGEGMEMEAEHLMEVIRKLYDEKF